MVNPTTDNHLKKCNKCKNTKEFSEFNNNKSTPDGKCYQCRECDSAQNKRYYKNHRKERLDAGKIYHSKNPDAFRGSRYRRRYGITLERYNELLEQQNQVCAICGNTEKMYGHLVVDHDHKTGEVRGLLCTNCNKALGNAFDDIQILENMITYLNNAYAQFTATK